MMTLRVAVLAVLVSLDGSLTLATGMAAHKGKLSGEAKVFVVTSLAMYDTPSQIVKGLKDDFGVEITRQGVQDYDPTVGKVPAKKWVALFEVTRQTFLEDTSRIPIANRAVRLRRLDRMATKLEESGNRLAAAQLMEQAAKDAGGSFTNRREITGKGGKPLPSTAVWVVAGKEIPL